MSASVPRILQSADEAPCGSLIAPLSDLANVILRWPSGEGFIMVEATHRAWCPSDGWEWSACEDHDFPAHLIAEGLTKTECRHLSGLSAADALAWCEARDKAATASGKRPQPGDVVPWAEVEDGCLYYNKNTACPFVTVVDRHHQVMNDARDPDIARFLKAPRDFDSAGKPPTHAYGDGATLVARDLGTDPEAWRKAMREWTANGNCPSNTLNPVGSTTAALRYEIKMIDDAARRERDDARVGWAEQTADAARLRIALQEAQRRLVQAHEDIDTLIAKQTFEIAALKQDRTWAQEGRQTMHILACGNELLAQHHARIVGRLLDEMARGYFVDRFLDPNLYADAMKAAGREVKP